MIILVVDDERPALEMLIGKLEEVVPEAQIIGFRKETELLEYIENNDFDVVFLDIQLKNMSGIQVAEKIKEYKPQANIVFVTGYSEYMSEAFALHASGYVLKPPSSEAVLKELSNLRYPFKKTKNIEIQCFGNFEILYKGAPVRFKRTKTKELLAYIVSRNGVFCTNNEIISVLWEDVERNDKYQGYYRILIADLLAVLTEIGEADIMHKKRGMISIAPEKVSCDYYDYINGNDQVRKKYTGEYMAQYSWGEFVNAWLWDELHAKNNR